MNNGINPHITRKKRPEKSLEAYLEGLAAGDRYILSEVLTIVESTAPSHEAMAQQILATVSPTDSSDTLRIGITGSPGAGKSTLIEQLGLHLVAQGKRVAVLAIDPSSTRTDGSILGDKTRMTQLSNTDLAYVRPTASATHLGGVSRTTKESIAICEKAGYDIILVESVGVGQSEVELAGLVDAYVLVLLPGGGDDVQGIKRGVVELADLLIINKADGDRLPLAKESKKDYAGAIRLFPHELAGYIPEVLLTSALTGDGVDKLWEAVETYVQKSKEAGYFSERRQAQDEAYMKQQVVHYLQKIVAADELLATSDYAKDSEQASLFAKTKRLLDSIAQKLNS